MFNVLDMHNKYTVRIFIVSLYKITKIIDYNPPPHLLLELMSPVGGGGTLVGGLLDVGYVEGVRWGEGVRWRGGVSWGGGVWGGGVVDVKSWSKML